MNKDACKICGGKVSLYAHTAKCRRCGVLFYHPCPTDEELLLSIENLKGRQNDSWMQWYLMSSFYNHVNFTNMLRFTVEHHNEQALTILDYGGGGGQFALVATSCMPKCKVYMTDICDDSLLSVWAPYNQQILFSDIEADETRFDIVFLNDVLEHVSNPLAVLQMLAGKLTEGGKIFIDTPRQFWVYTVLRLICRPLYRKLLLGTVSKSHLQVWSNKAFTITIKEAGLKIVKYKKVCEFSREPAFYIKTMRIENPLLVRLCIFFYRIARYVVRNKILCVCEKNGKV